MSFWYLQFSQKTNEKIRLYYYGTSSRIVFVRFLGELKTPKRHFEINWPLVLSRISVKCLFRKNEPELVGTLFSWTYSIIQKWLVNCVINLMTLKLSKKMRYFSSSKRVISSKSACAMTHLRKNGTSLGITTKLCKTRNS